MKGLDVAMIHNLVGILGMRGHELSLIAVQGYLVQGAAVGLGEIGHLKVTFQDLCLAQETCLDNLVFLELLL